MDIRMPDLDGLGATRLITADEDLAGVRVLILTTFEIDEYVFEALRAGASGFLGKSAEPDELLDAIRVVHRGDALLSPAATRSLIARYLAQPDRGRHPVAGAARRADRPRARGARAGRHRPVQRGHRRPPGRSARTRSRRTSTGR